jgi:uncharacterized protein DUF992
MLKREVFLMIRFAAIVSAGGIAVATLASSADAQTLNRVKVGTLVCDISGGVGFVIGSQKQVFCRFNPEYSGWSPEAYIGTISKFGLDLGATAGGQMVWAVYAPTTRRAWALAGQYTGASAEATVGVGAGANVLIGGSERTVSLQPVSVQGQAGLNVAAGVAELDLQPAR